MVERLHGSATEPTRAHLLSDDEIEEMRLKADENDSDEKEDDDDEDEQRRTQ